MNKKGRIYTVLFIITGIIPVFVFVFTVLFPTYPDSLLSPVPRESQYYISSEFGYEGCLLRPNAKPENADLFVFGDSFVPYVDQLIEENTSQDVFSMFSHEKMKDERKIEQLFNKNNITKVLQAYGIPKSGSHRRKLVVVSVERLLFTRFAKNINERDVGFVDEDIRNDNLESKREYETRNKFVHSIKYGLKSGFENFKSRASRYSFFWQKSLPTFQLSQGIKRMRKLFWGNIIPLEVVQKDDWHFVEKTLINLESKSIRNKAYLDMIVNNIKKIQNELSEEYNLELILMPIPDKISLYGEEAFGKKYDNFLPRLYKSLKKNNVPVVELFDEFSERTDTIYFMNDAHWNKKGLELGVDLLMESIGD